MSISVVVHLSVDSSATRVGRTDWLVLVAAISRNGWGSRAEVLARYRHVPLPGGSGQWTGRATLETPPNVGDLAPLETPFGVLEPVAPMYSRALFMPKVTER